MNEQTKRAIEQARTVPAVARKERSTQDVEKCAAHVLSALANLGGASRSDLLRAFRWMRADEFNGACRLLLDEGLITVYKAKRTGGRPTTHLYLSEAGARALAQSTSKR